MILPGQKISKESQNIETHLSTSTSTLMKQHN